MSLAGRAHSVQLPKELVLSLDRWRRLWQIGGLTSIRECCKVLIVRGWWRECLQS